MAAEILIPTPILEPDVTLSGIPEASVLVIYTGGTAGMAYNKRGELVPTRFELISKKIPELLQLNMQVDGLSLLQPIDSSNMTPDIWLTIAALIGAYYPQYDGFVVLHGTDTMAHSAAALSFLLDNLGKPVVFTGAQLPMGRIRTDARRNLITALEIAAGRHPRTGLVRVPEVTVFFNDLLIRGNRAKKVESRRFNAFRSENYPPLAHVGIDLEFHDALIRPVAQAPLCVHRTLDDRVAVLKLFPGITERVVRAVLETEDLRGCVLETYGSGNAPTAKWFLQCLREANDRGVQVLNVSQCEEGRVVQGLYETSARLTEAGVIGGEDITFEAAVAKLMFVLGLRLPAIETSQMLATDLRGEISSVQPSTQRLRF